MKVLQINTTYKKGSTGNIAYGIQQLCRKSNIDNVVAYRYREELNNESSECVEISSWLDCHVHNRLVRYFWCEGLLSKCKTRKFITYLKKKKPDIIHFHNLHGNYINLPLIFKFLKKNEVKTIWTLHDCWAFTGHCPYFDIVKCDKWQNGCYKCPQYGKYPKSLFDNSKKMWKLKKKWFTGVKDLTIVTPSEWLAGLVKQSFLKNYTVKVINNGIDLNIFKPTKSDFREKYNIGNKFIVLGVAFGWGERKGLDVFVELAQRLDNEKYQIVLVGTEEGVDKLLPQNIISIHRTQNQYELAGIYTAANVFANPTREENYPTVNMEAIACGTPVITFNTGGSPEILTKKTGSVVGYNDINAMEAEIIRICETKPYSEDNCIERAKNFDMNDRFKEYIELYGSINE